MVVGASQAVGEPAKKSARTSRFVIPKELPAAARMPLKKLVNIGITLW